jgi:hypothetical protein|tara:strand:- start:15 stop:185 length:171 start_codon:yes stop_codon:yes gene_type:complete
MKNNKQLLEIKDWLESSLEGSQSNLELEKRGSVGFWSEMARIDLIEELKQFIEENV